MGKDLFRDLKRVAQTLDSINGGEAYQKVCDELVACFDNPDLTFSARILRSMIDTGIGGTGKAFAEAYRNLLREEPLEILREEDFVAEREASERRQQEWSPLIPNRLRCGWKNTPDRKQHVLVSGQNFISEFRDDA